MLNKSLREFIRRLDSMHFNYYFIYFDIFVDIVHSEFSVILAI